MARSEIEALGYVRLEVSDPARWHDFATSILGLQASPFEDDRFDLRCDAYARRIRVSRGPSDDLDCAGWEVRDEAALERLAAHLESSSHEVERCDEADAASQSVAGLIRFEDPEGNRLEAFYGPLQKADRPFVSPLGVSFNTGRQGLGHIVLACADKALMLDFYAGVLGFRLTDHIRTEVVPGRPLEISFLRCNARHHSLALVPLSLPRKLVHLMLEVSSIDDVGRALDRCRAQGVHISFTLGRHSNDNMLSFYALSPSGFDVEYGWGGLEVDDDAWHVVTHASNSAWGHVFQRPPRAEKG